MKFGVVLPVVIGGNAGPRYDETLRVCRLAEEHGFDFATVSHHRFHPSYPSSPFVVLSALAATTERIRLGTNIAVLPAMHPVDVAEQVATVDRISGGRVYIGAGTGYLPKEFEVGGFAFGSRGERMSEAIQVLRLLLSEERASFAGDHFRFEDVELQPRPIQRPNPPILVGAQMKRAVRRAARLGDGWTTDSKTTLRELAPLVALFREEANGTADGRSRVISRATRCSMLARSPDRSPLTPVLGIEGTAWDVASATLFLASAESRFITGVCLPVDGGVTAIGALAAHQQVSGMSAGSPVEFNIEPLESSE
jgi:probable F420-dependent oxidoreductase